MMRWQAISCGLIISGLQKKDIFDRTVQTE